MNLQRLPKPSKVKIDDSIFTKNLSSLGPCETGDYAYLRLTLEDMSLESIQGIQNFPHLQHLNLSKNKLSTLRALNSLRHLLTLNISSNCLSTITDFDPPKNLLYIDASNNKIKTLGKVANNQYLQRLNLDSNQISEIAGIEELPNLQVLSLNSNKILRISGLPVSLQSLNLGRNEIQKIGIGFSKLKFLRIADLSYNKLTSLRGAEELESLMEIKLVGNLISRINTLDHLAGLALLSDLDLSGNAACAKAHYRLQVAYKLPQLRSMDGSSVAAEEKIKAENLYGLDIEDRKALFSQIFAGQSFLDRRLEKSELLDLESNSEEDDEYLPSKNSNTGSRIASRILSKAASREQLDSGTVSDILAFSRRYVGELIEREEERRKTRVNFEE